MRGDFEEAERRSREYERAIASISDDVLHWTVTYERMLDAFETGRSAEVVRLGRDYLHRRPAWQANDFGVEPTIYVYALERLAGGLTEPDFARLRDEWTARDEKRVAEVGGTDYAATRWAVAQTLTVATPPTRSRR